MVGRIPFGLILSLTVLVCWPIQAQDQADPPPGYFGVLPGGPLPFHNDPGQYHAVPGYMYQQGQGPQIPGPPPRMVYEQLPDDLGFGDPDTPIGNYLTNAFRHASFRGEYLLWNISGPGSQILGAQTSTGVPNTFANGGGSGISAVLNPTTNQTVNVTGGPQNIAIQPGLYFARTVNSVSGASQSPYLDNFAIDGLSGFRGTFSLPVPVGEIEMGGFILGAVSTQFNSTGMILPQITGNPASVVGSPVGTDGNPAVNPQVANFISQALLVNGAPQAFSGTSSAFIDYDISYSAKLTTSAWGSEANYVMDSSDPGAAIQLRPIVGFRYFNFRDRLNQGGQYNQANPTDPTGAPTVVTRTIDSGSNNNLYGPQVGLRAEYSQNQFSIGFEPKLLMALNTYQQQLNTSNVLSSTDPAQNVLQNTTTFSPLIDLKGYASIALSKYVSAYASYNFMYVTNVNRSYNDFLYNKNSVTNQSDFILQKTLSAVTLQGVSVGFSFRY